MPNRVDGFAKVAPASFQGSAEKKLPDQVSNSSHCREDSCNLVRQHHRRPEVSCDEKCQRDTGDPKPQSWVFQRRIISWIVLSEAQEGGEYEETCPEKHANACPGNFCPPRKLGTVVNRAGLEDGETSDCGCDNHEAKIHGAILCGV